MITNCLTSSIKKRQSACDAMKDCIYNNGFHIVNSLCMFANHINNTNESLTRVYFDNCKFSTSQSY